MLPTSALQLSPPPLHASNCPKWLAVTPKGDPGKPQKGCLMRMASLLFFLPCDTWKLQCVYHDSCELQSIQAYTSGLGHTWWSPHTDRMDSRGWEGVSLNSKKVCMWSGHALRLKWLQVYTHTRAHTRTKYSLNAHTMQTVVPLHPSASLLLLHLHMLSSCTEAFGTILKYYHYCTCCGSDPSDTVTFKPWEKQFKMVQMSLTMHMQQHQVLYHLYSIFQQHIQQICLIISNFLEWAFKATDIQEKNDILLAP